MKIRRDDTVRIIAGKDTAGIIRSHQFYKLEQFIFCHPDDSEQWFVVGLAKDDRTMPLLAIKPNLAFGCFSLSCSAATRATMPL